MESNETKDLPKDNQQRKPSDMGTN